MSTLSKDIIGAFLRRTSALIFKEIFSYLTGTVAQNTPQLSKTFYTVLQYLLIFSKKMFSIP